MVSPISPVTLACRTGWPGKPSASRTGAQRSTRCVIVIGSIRARIDYRAQHPSNEIGCILLAQPTFFTSDEWVRGPHDWPPANLRHKRNDLSIGEGLRIWDECRARAASGDSVRPTRQPSLVREDSPRYGAPQVVEPRLGQGIFPRGRNGRVFARVRRHAEHSLPALEASRIQPVREERPARGSERHFASGRLASTV